MKFLHLNCRSLSSKWNEINKTLLCSELDVIVLSETWLHSNIQNSLIWNSDYKLFRLDRQACLPSGVVKKGGGLCMYVKNGITV